MAEVVTSIPPIKLVVVVEPAGAVTIDPAQSQSPAVSETLVMFLALPDVNETAEPDATEDDWISPMYPALADDPDETPWMLDESAGDVITGP